jgi:integrase
MARTKHEIWSYSAGEHGTNRVRAYERALRGDILLLYRERNAAGTLRRRRISLGRCTRDEAKAKADELAAAFRRHGADLQPRTLTLAALFDIYDREVSREKGDSKRRHDERCRELFLRAFGADRDPATLSRREWDSFVGGRRRGTLAPAKAKKGRPVRDRVVAYDLRYLLAVLNWATVASSGRGGFLMERNPLKGLPLPTEPSPVRPVITADQYAKLRAAADSCGILVELLLVLCHETGHRVGSVRRLAWSDIDLAGRSVSWRAAADKERWAHATPLTDEAVHVLARVRRVHRAIGDAWVFPSPADRKNPWSRHYARDIWERLANKAGLPTGQRYGWHALRRRSPAS